MHTSDPSAEGSASAPGAESPGPATPPVETSGPPPLAKSEAAPAETAGDAAPNVAPDDASAETNGPAIELALETVELSDAEAAAAAGAPDPAEGSAPVVPLPGDVALPGEAAFPGGIASPLAVLPSELTPPVALPPEPPYTPSSWFLGISAFLVAAADIGTKEWAKWALAGPDLKRSGKHIEAIPGHLDFIFAQNPGGAWSFLRSVPDGIRRPFFLFVSAAAIVFIVMVYGRLERRQWAMRWGLPLALGGAIGNLSDRMRYGWVVDFIDAYYKGAANEVHWPTFNIADVAIVFGVGLMALDLLSLRHAHPTEPASSAASGAT